MSGQNAVHARVPVAFIPVAFAYVWSTTIQLQTAKEVLKITHASIRSLYLRFTDVNRQVFKTLQLVMDDRSTRSVSARLCRLLSVLCLYSCNGPGSPDVQVQFPLAATRSISFRDSTDLISHFSAISPGRDSIRSSISFPNP